LPESNAHSVEIFVIDATNVGQRAFHEGHVRSLDAHQIVATLALIGIAIAGQIETYGDHLLR